MEYKDDYLMLSEYNIFKFYERQWAFMNSNGMKIFTRLSVS